MPIFKFDKAGKFGDKDIGHYEDSCVQEVEEYVRKYWRDSFWRIVENTRHYEFAEDNSCPTCGR